jgi:nitroreductase
VSGGSPLRSLVEAATRAPSGDNTQPWRFALDESAGRIGIHLDETRDPSPMNAGQRMARIALGAALENLLREAEHRGWAFTLERAVPPALAAVRVKVREGAAPGDAAIPARVTNRRPYDGRPAPDAVLSKLSSLTAPLDGVTTHWITGPERTLLEFHWR